VVALAISESFVSCAGVTFTSRAERRVDVLVGPDRMPRSSASNRTSVADQ